MTSKEKIAGGCAAIARMAGVSLFQPHCRLCGSDLVLAGEKIICRDCRQKVRPATENQCRRCGKFIPAGIETCGSCLLQPSPFLRHISYAAYEGPLREIIILYKYGELEPLRTFLASLYLDMVRTRLPGGFQAVVPVPVDRQRRHGFMPVRAMGRLLARELELEFLPGLLRKTKSTPPQVGLTQAQRKTNLDGAFALATARSLAGKEILLIDDVITTGTTIGKCAALLKKKGARVTALTLAQSRF
ncbi:MAG: ComF family protein [Candidatus Aminicenantes bacterium]|nr:ComF family protein [Candidatus Aminicenantes bacterium]